MKKALITGITGQDGSYLAELLLEKGYEVHGIIRRASVSTTARIDHIMDKITIHEGDLSDSSSIIRIVLQVKPDEIYNLAAQSHVQVSFDAAEYTGDVDALGVLRILEAVHIAGLEKTCRIYQASTSELYGKVEECPQSETTPFHPYSPYAVAKQYGFWMIKEYREAYGMFACNGILFNHESERRGDNFVTRKITLAAGRIACGLQDHLELGNLDSLRDWGYAKDYVECMWLILQQDEPDDFVIATGVQHTVREFTTLAFANDGIELEWKGAGIMHVWHRYNRKSHVCTFLIYGEGFERMKKVFIFGIGGFAGSYLAQEFIDNGYVVAGSDKVKSESLNKLVDFVEADLLNAENIEKIVSEKKPDMIINLAAISSVGASWGIPQITMSVNVIGALNIMEAARKIDNRPKVMFIGSSEEYAVSDKPMNEQTILNANNPYGISKMAQEKFAEVYRERYGMQIYCVRPFNHTGIGQRDSFVLPSFCKQAAVIERSGKPGTIKVGNLAAERDFSDVRDIVRAYRMIIENSDCTRIYNVGSGKAYKLSELLNYIVSLSKQKITVEIDPERFRPVDTQVICCNHELISKELGWKPKYSIFDTLKGMFDSYLCNI